ncbi:MAG: hypothetical protein ACRDZ8_01760 [Acidimicrobiales bacterium]
MTFAITAVILVLVGVVLAVISHRPAKSKAPGAAAPPAATTTSPGSATSATTTSGSATTVTPTTAAVGTIGLPLVVCPTTFGITPPPAAPTQPSTVEVSVPASVQAQLAVYGDSHATMRLVAPRGWHCRAAFGADGSGGVVVYPDGVTPPSGGSGAGWLLDPLSTVEAVAGQETSACSSCTTSQACPLFGAAAQEFQTAFGRPCPTTRQAAETVHQQSANVVTFQDPPTIAGDAVPSGGANPADGAMTYYPGNPSGSWLATCTLPLAKQQLCTVSLNAFLASYRDN